MKWSHWSSQRRLSGTRFRLYPQAPYGSAEHRPQTMWLSPAAGSVGPGPQDGRMHVIDPVGKQRPYGVSLTAYGTPYLFLPPWGGPIRAPAMPDADGHFDHLRIGTPEFEAAHAYGSIRFALDIWERYFGRRIRWHFWPRYKSLEVVLLRQLNNATSGFGFMEIGSDVTPAGQADPFSLNFDVVGHELGHLIIYAEVGLPADDAIDGEYFGFHEAAADLSALVATMHFDAVLDHLLETYARQSLYLQRAQPVRRAVAPHPDPDRQQRSQTLRLRDRLARRARAVATADRRDFRHPGRYLR